MRYFRKVIRIAAVDSPSVKLGLNQAARGLTPTDEAVVPGVLTWGEYQKRRATWDAVRQCVGLDAQFYQGAELLLFPPAWLDRAEKIHAALQSQGTRRQAKAIGIDPAEGGDKSVWAVIDELGLLALRSLPTPNTTVVTAITAALMHEWDVPAHMVVFDRGGGGKEHADRMRLQGLDVRTVAFGEAIVIEPKRSKRLYQERKDVREEHYAYKNRRAEMYADLSAQLDPAHNPRGFALPGIGHGTNLGELRKQLAVFPRLYDEEGTMFIPPKNKKPGQRDGAKGPAVKTLTELIGHSPDEADALALAVCGMLRKVRPAVAGAV